MAANSASHVRSSSWPEDVHPLTRTIEDHLLKLSESQSMCQKLGVLKSLYEVVDDFLHLSMTHEASADLEDVSDGFLRVLDICSRARDIFLQMKENVRELESTLRRRSKLGDACLVREIDAYMSKRRAMERDVKTMMKRNEKKKKKDSGHDNVLKQVEQKSFEVLVSLLFVVSQSHKVRPRRSGKGFVSKVFHLKNADSEDAKTEVIGLLEADLERMKSRNMVAAMELQKLKETEVRIQEIERDLECVYRKLVKTRVSLLNMLTN